MPLPQLLLQLPISFTIPLQERHCEASGPEQVVHDAWQSRQTPSAPYEPAGHLATQADPDKKKPAAQLKHCVELAPLQVPHEAWQLLHLTSAVALHG
jgi:hypothetical protein